MSSIEEMTQGWWRPSPGTIYPLLANLEAEGLIRKMKDGRYELTESSREEMDWTPGWPRGRAGGAEGMMNELNGFISYFEDLSKSDKARFGAYLNQLIALRDRLAALTKEGGEKQ